MVEQGTPIQLSNVMSWTRGTDQLKGPDVLNPIRAVLLRFREGRHAALGDIKKMYNSVWLEEMHLHRSLWRDSPDEENVYMQLPEYITPNTLHLGSASPKGDLGDFQFDGYPYKRLQSIQAEVNKFWLQSELAGKLTILGLRRVLLGQIENTCK